VTTKNIASIWAPSWPYWSPSWPLQ